MSDYDLQFQAELERAQALSLESLALEQFRRQRRANSVTETVTADSYDGPPLRPFRSRQLSNEPIAIPPVLPPPPRRPSRSLQGSRSSCDETQPIAVPSEVKSTSNSPTRDEISDLISFTSPNSTKKAHDTLKEYIQQIHTLTKNTEEMSLIPKNGSTFQSNTHPPPPYNVQAPPPYTPHPPQNVNYQYHQSVQSVQAIHSTYLHQQLPPGMHPRYAMPPTYNGAYSVRYPYPPAPNGSNNPHYNPLIHYPSYSPMPQQYSYHQQNVNAPVPGFQFQNYGSPTVPSYPMNNPTYPNYYSTPNPQIPPAYSAVPQHQSHNTSNSQLDAFHTRSETEIISTSSVSDISSNTSRSDFSRRLSETSNTSENSNESNDTIVSLRNSTNLIDLSTGPNFDNGNVRVSVLEAFDPLLINRSNTDYITASEGSCSVYDEFDPLDFLNEDRVSRETPVYSRKVSDAVPSPPPKSVQYPSLTVKPSTTNKLYDSVSLVKTRHHDAELLAFLNMVKSVRGEFSFRDMETNPGYIVAARSNSTYPPNTSIKLLVYYQCPEDPVTFTSDVNSTVEHIIMHVVCEMDAAVKDDMSSYMLRVWGRSEYLTPGSSLCEYDYVRQCVRLEKDVLLCLEDNSKRTLARTEQDDNRDSFLTLDELLPNQTVNLSLSYDDLSILLETLEGELSRAIGTAVSEGSCQPRGVVQAVKAICALAGGLETAHLTTTLAEFVQACGHYPQINSDILKPEIVAESGPYCHVALRVAGPKEAVALHCQRIRDAIRDLLALYSRTNRVDFRLNDIYYSHHCDLEKAIPLYSIQETALFSIEALHRIPVNWKYDDYILSAQIFHGTRPLKSMQVTQPMSIENTGFYPRVMFDTWLNLDEISISTLPRESRLVLSLFGRIIPGPENQPTGAAGNDKSVDLSQHGDHGDNKQSHSTQHGEDVRQIEQIELGWAAIQLFNHDGLMMFGNFALPVWPNCVDKRLGPAPHVMQYPPTSHCVVNIEIPQYSVAGIRWPAEDVDLVEEGSEGVSCSKDVACHGIEALDMFTRNQIMHFVEQGTYNKLPIECREIIWDKRHYLVDVPRALPLVLSTTINWDVSNRNQLLSLVRKWKPLAPYDAMHLLLPCFPDAGIREVAVTQVALLSDSCLAGILPQLVQALRYESSAGSPLARLLLKRSLACPAIAHKLYWLFLSALSNKQPTDNEWLGLSLDESRPSTATELDPVVLMAARWSYRYHLMMRALLTVIGNNLSQRLRNQHLLIKGLSDIASNVKSCKESARMRTLVGGIEYLASSVIRSDDICLPLSLSMEVNDIDVKSCSYFASFTLPLKISFTGRDNAVIPAMFKAGDDLRQDALVLQVIKLMDSLWLEDGLDLRMVNFQAVPTHARKGMIEIVTEAETLRVIQTEWGLTGSFKDRPIAEWLAKHNPSELEYERARDNFTASCAGYSVATYLLGICDRHNDNIMLKTSGHLFHIDFGKFLGDAQMFGNFKRDRTPFVLTPDMAYVINDGERPSQKFHYFVELCCTAFNIVRRHHNLILDLFALMATSGVPGVTNAAVNYVRGALLPGSSHAEAAAAFARLIHSSMKSKFTPINFFLHNLAQLRAAGTDQANSSSELLTFMPRTYTMLQDGRLLRVEVLGFEKRYEPEKHYVYTLRIYRQGQTTPFTLYRSFKHFYELYQKLCLHFPLAKVSSGLTQGMAIGRTTTRQVAERRLPLVQAFLHSLFSLADEVAHSDLVYTFFHPLLRDQQPVEPQRLKNSEEVRNSDDQGAGALKISVQYTAGVLSVLILHAQSLAITSQGVPPNPYVKVYLLPDPSKETKRKTRVLKRNCHPSFMEMLEYRLPLEVIRGRSLQATVWHYDPLQENQFLGGTILPLDSLPLTTETVAWYTLEYMPR